MTKEEILAMEAGRELDALIATEIMGYQGVGFYRRKSRFTSGWEPCAKDDVTPDTPEWKATLAIWREDGETFAVKRYSTDISAAWQVVEKLASEGFTPSIVFSDEKHWGMTAYCQQESVVGDFTLEDVVWCDTAPEAICKAALMAKLANE